MWSVQHRPTTFEEIVGNPKVVAGVKALVADKERGSTILLCGPPGSGKTTLCKVAVRGDTPHVFLNASLDRSAAFVKRRVLPFARRDTRGIVVLDEIDSMTTDAQLLVATAIADRRCADCVWIMTCNYYGRLHEELVKVAFCVRMNPIGPDDVGRVLQRHAPALTTHDRAVIASHCGDVRHALNAAQTLTRVPGCLSALFPAANAARALWQLAIDAADSRGATNHMLRCFHNGVPLVEQCVAFAKECRTAHKDISRAMNATQTAAMCASPAATDSVFQIVSGQIRIWRAIRRIKTTLV